MIINTDLLSEDRNIRADVCIAGAGVAGISLAREFIGADFNVCLLEGGGLEPYRANQSLYWGENVGHPYFELDTARGSGFGGSSNRWSVPLKDDVLGVRLRPLDPIDFEKRSWIPYSGWPFSKQELDPYYERAHKVCQIGPYEYDAGYWEDPQGAKKFPLLQSKVRTVMFQFGPRQIFYSRYKDQISNAENITTFVNANVMELEKRQTGENIISIRARSLKGRELKIHAKVYILALGGIETPRIMLLSNNTMRSGLGNQNDLVGRFFMEHPHLWSGYYVPDGNDTASRTGLYEIREAKGTYVMGKFAISEKILREEQLLNYCVSMHKRIVPSWKAALEVSAGVDSLKAIGSAVRKGKWPQDMGGNLRNIITDLDEIGSAFCRKARTGWGSGFDKWAGKSVIFWLNHMSEQSPNPESRITLSEEKDLLGRRRARLNWQLSPLDIRTIIRGQDILDKELRRAGLGKLIKVIKKEEPPQDLHGGWHHMGTTRMDNNPEKGVVDADCRVHGINNLYIAGPSLFPTSGFANPVLTTVALSLRLGDHIRKKMGTVPLCG